MKKSIGIILIIGIVLTLVLLIGILPSVSDYQAKHRIYTDMQTDLSDVMNANIRIVSVDKHDGGIAYGAGSSGVVIEKTENKYYALTAFHVLANDEIDYFVVITPDDPSVFDYKKEHEGVGQEEYYNQFPKVKVEFEKENLIWLLFHLSLTSKSLSYKSQKQCLRRRSNSCDIQSGRREVC